MLENITSTSSMDAGIIKTATATATAGNIQSIADPASNFNAPKPTPDSTHNKTDDNKIKLEESLYSQLKKARNLQIDIDGSIVQGQSLFNSIDDIKNKLKEAITKLDKLTQAPLENNTKGAKNGIENTMATFPQMNLPV